MKSLGMINIRSGWQGHYLQAKRADDLEHTGELHCSRDTANLEETFFLFEMDAAQHTYAIHSYETANQKGGFLSVLPDGCARANATLITIGEQFEIRSGKGWGIPNAVTIKSMKTGHFLGTNRPDDDIEKCGGEVGCGIGAKDNKPVTPSGDPLYHGWWTLEIGKKPDNGPDILSIAQTVIQVISIAETVIGAIYEG